MFIGEFDYCGMEGGIGRKVDPIVMEDYYGLQ